MNRRLSLAGAGRRGSASVLVRLVLWYLGSTWFAGRLRREMRTIARWSQALTAHSLTAAPRGGLHLRTPHRAMRYKSLPLSVRATPRPAATPSRRPPQGRRLRDWIATIPVLLLVPAIVLGSAQVDAGTPSITAPETVETGETFTVTGRGFVPRAKLHLAWDGSMDGMPRVRASAAGDFSAQLQVPANASPGSHHLAVVDSWRPEGTGSDRSANESTPIMAATEIQLIAVAEVGGVATTPVAAPSHASAVPTITPAATSSPTASPSPTAVSTPVPTATATPVAQAPAATPTVAPTSAPSTGGAGPVGSLSVQSGIWLSQSQLMALPASGAAWERLVSQAQQAIPRDDLSCQDASSPQSVMAAALVAARLNDNALRAKVRDELMRVIGTENGSTCGHPDRNRPLGLGRNLAPYVIAADLIGFRAFDPGSEGTWRAWLSALRSKPLVGGWALNSAQARSDHSNWGAHQAAALTAANAYLGDAAALALDAANARSWVDPAASQGWVYHTNKHDYSWSSTGTPPAVPVNPAGAVKDGVNIDGIPLVDMQRGGGFTTGKPATTDYPRESLVGRTVQFEILHRAGYDAYSWGNRGLLRVAQRLLAFSKQWDSAWYDARINAYWVLEARYRAGLPRAEGARGRQVVGVDWTHR